MIAHLEPALSRRIPASAFVRDRSSSLPECRKCPRIPFMRQCGISWLILARKLDFAILARMRLLQCGFAGLLGLYQAGNVGHGIDHRRKPRPRRAEIGAAFDGCVAHPVRAMQRDYGGFAPLPRCVLTMLNGFSLIPAPPGL